jgi:DNA-binding MarR family transcriptional regulator
VAEGAAEARVLSIDWERLSAVMTGERYRLLRYLHANPSPSVSALARHLGRHIRRVQVDVQALEAAGLVDRSTGTVLVTADRICAEIVL